MQPWRLDRSRQCHCEPRIGVKQSQSNDLAMSSITPSAGTPRNAPPILSCPRHFLSFSPIRQAQGRLRRGSPILLSGIFFNKSLPRCEHSLAHHNDCSAQSCSRIYEIASLSPTQLVDTSCFRLTDSLCSTVRSGSPHLGQKTKAMAMVYMSFCNQERLLQVRTVATGGNSCDC